MKKIIWGIILVVVIVIVLLTSNSKDPIGPGGTAPILIGADLSLSGDAAQDGESIKNGLELAKADLGKTGVSVNIVYQDDKTDGKDTVSAIQALNAQGAQAIVGPTWSFLADAGIPVANQLHLVTVMPANTSEYVSASSSYAFFMATKVHQLVPTLTDWFKAQGKKKIAFVGDQGAWYSTVDKAVKEAATAAGAKIVYTDTMTFGQEAGAMPTVLAKVKASGADLLFAEVDNDKGISVMLKKIVELGIDADIMSVSTGIGRVLGSNAASFTGKNHFYVLAPKTSQAFIDKYQIAYGKKPTAYADTAYDSLMLLVEAIQNRGTTPLQDYMRNKTDYKGFANEYKFDANGDVIGGSWLVNTIR